MFHKKSGFYLSVSMIFFGVSCLLIQSFLIVGEISLPSIIHIFVLSILPVLSLVLGSDIIYRHKFSKAQDELASTYDLLDEIKENLDSAVEKNSALSLSILDNTEVISNLELQLFKLGSLASSLERKTALALDNLGIEYETQKRFPECRHKAQLPFDFYFTQNGVEYCIECDGRQHFEPIDYFGGVDSFDQIKIRDGVKSKYCLENNINLIRIPYNALKCVDSAENAILNGMLTSTQN